MKTDMFSSLKVMHGVVRTVVEWGAFVALPEAENLEGLVHVTEASHDPRTPLAELFRATEAAQRQSRTDEAQQQLPTEPPVSAAPDAVKMTGTNWRGGRVV